MIQSIQTHIERHKSKFDINKYIKNKGKKQAYSPNISVGFHR